MWYVYILKCEQNRYYVGITNSIERRVAIHQRGLGARFTKQNRPEKILYQEPFGTKALAMEREKQLKRWSRAKKTALIAGNIDKLRRLSTSHD
jgi:predicted GIY-YIG superfamily endonuclease